MRLMRIGSTALLFSLILSAGCGNQGNGAGQTDTYLNVADSARAATKGVTVTQARQPASCEIVFDISASMRGYVDASVAGDFPGVVSSLTVLPSKQATSLLFDTKGQTVNDFTSKLERRDFNWKNESDLFKMMDHLLNSAARSSDGIYALVTDGIMSASNAEVEANPNYNVVNHEVLSSRIDSIVSKVAPNKVTVFVARYMAPFRGDYYRYDNSKEELNNEMRPFYIIIAGGADHVKYAADKLREEKRAAMETATFGEMYPVWVTTSAKLISPGVYKYQKDQGELIVTLNLGDLPAKVRTKPYLERNLEVTLTRNAKGARPTRLELNKDYTIRISGTNAKVVMTRNVTTLLPAHLTFGVQRVMPAWINDVTTADDIKAYAPDRTLNLSDFLKPLMKLNGGKYYNSPEATGIVIIK